MKKDVDITNLLRPIVDIRRRWFKTDVTIYIGIRKDGQLERLAISSDCFDEDGEEETNVMELKREKLPADRLSYIG